MIDVVVMMPVPLRRAARTRATAVALIVLASVVSACGWQAPPPPARDPAVADLLWLPPQAQMQPDQTNPLLVRNGRSVYEDGTAGVSFTVDMDCDELVGLVLTQASSSEWHRRSTPLDNPQEVLPPGNRCLPGSSGDAGWAGEWNDNRGNVISYRFGGPPRQLRGKATFQPHDLVVRKNATTRP